MKQFNLQFLVATAVLLAISLGGSLQDTCTVTEYDQVADTVKNCTDIVLDGITVPAGKTLELSLQTGTNLTFEGTTQFNYSEWEGPLVEIKGSKVTVQGASGAVLDGQGANYWDGEGDGGSTKPKFFRIATTGGSTFSNITLKNCPVQCVSIHQASDTTLKNWTIDVSDGDSGGGHNTDGFDVSLSSNVLVENCVIKNQDDCVAVNQGSDLIFKELTCIGGHGLSLSVGISADDGIRNTVSNVTFSNCTVQNSQNGIHIKTHPAGGNGSITNVTYSDIVLSGIDNYGINIQENYPHEDEPKANVPITGLDLTNVTGSMSGSSSVAVYILCADSGCSDWSWSEVYITNAQKENDCNFTPSGFTC